MNKIIIILLINIYSFILYGIDKYKAIKKKRRISENTLLTVSIPGSYGALLGMILFHHKIRKIKFLIFIPLFMIINFLILKEVIN